MNKQEIINDFIENVKRDLFKLHKRKFQTDDGFHHWKNGYGKNQYTYEWRLLKRIFEKIQETKKGGK